MYTFFSCYLQATEKANETTFFSAVENWLIGRNNNYGFDFQKKPLKDCNSIISGERATLQITKGIVKSNYHIAISLDNESNNMLWMVECIFTQSLDKSNGSFVIHLSKKICDPDKSATYSRTEIPKLSQYLIEAGIAIKDNGTSGLDLDEQEYEAILNESNNYPILIVNNSSKLKDSAKQKLAGLRSVCHIYYPNADTIDEKWTYKIIYPRLNCEIEYYWARLWDEVKSGETDNHRHSFISQKQLLENPYAIKQEIINLVNEGTSHLTSVDYRSVLDNISASTLTVSITDELANELKAARKRRNLTQNQLAEDVNKRIASEALTSDESDVNSQITGLLISRIESKRLRSIDSNKLNILKRCLGLPISALKDESPTDTTDSTPSNNMSNDEIAPKFCWHCGFKLPVLDNDLKIKFCPQCGKAMF